MDYKIWRYFPLIQTPVSYTHLSAIVNYRGKKLLDGGITKMIPIERALEQGCTKTLVITTKPKDYVRKPANRIVEFLMRIIYHKYPQIAKDYHVRHLNYYHQVEIINQQVEQGKAVHILSLIHI